MQLAADVVSFAWAHAEYLWQARKREIKKEQTKKKDTQPSHEEAVAAAAAAAAETTTLTAVTSKKSNNDRVEEEDSGSGLRPAEDLPWEEKESAASDGETAAAAAAAATTRDVAEAGKTEADVNAAVEMVYDDDGHKEEGASAVEQQQGRDGGGVNSNLPDLSFLSVSVSSVPLKFPSASAGALSACAENR